MSATGRTALAVVDLQRDFCSPGAAARHGLDPELLERAAGHTAEAVGLARSAGVEVVFVRFAGDSERQGASRRHRDRGRGKPPCRAPPNAGSWPPSTGSPPRPAPSPKR